MSEEQKIDMIIRIALKRIGIKTSLFGFDCMVEAIKFAIKNRDRYFKLSELYSAVAQLRPDWSVRRVCANIQNLVESSYFRGIMCNVSMLFGFSIFDKYVRPTPFEFIKTMAEYYVLGYYKKFDDFHDDEENQ